MPVRMLATVADCTQAEALIDRIAAGRLLAGRGYDTNAVLAAARERGMGPALPPKRNRKVAREYDRALYQARHLVENGFGKLRSDMGWRRVMPRMRRCTWRYARYAPWRCGPK